MQKYKNLLLVGTLPGSVIKSKRKMSRRRSSYVSLYGKLCWEKLSDLAGDHFYVVNPVMDNYYKSVLSWDEKPHYYYKDSYHSMALLFFDHYYGVFFPDCVASSEEICEYLDWSKSPGWPHTYFGFRFKHELVNVMEQTMFMDRVNTIPIYNVSGKIEFRTREDIEADKIRLFTVPCFELIWSQLKFGKRISFRIMNVLWSAFGFNPYSGGFDKLARKLLSKRWRGCYDISGWDKFLPLLKDIFIILAKRCCVPEQDLDEFAWMVNNTVALMLKLHNGDVIRKNYGNGSGSGTTTRDNIFGHVIIFASGLFEAYYIKVGSVPSFALVQSQIVQLYGDDNVFALDDEFSLMCDPVFLGKHLAKYGLKLKFFYGGLDCDLSVLSFLGANFKYFNGSWYPLYDVVRLATTMLYERSRLSLSQHLSKAFTLMVMSRPSSEFLVFYQAYNNLITDPLILKNLDDPVVASFALVGLPELYQIDAFYTGNEGYGFEGVVSFFTPLSELF